MSLKLEWNGRAVSFAEFDIRQGRVVRAAFVEDGEGGNYLCLVSSLRYADTGEPVFASVEEVWTQPFRFQQRILRLAAEAAKVNGLIDDIEEDRVTNRSGQYGETGEGDSAFAPPNPSPSP